MIGDKSNTARPSSDTLIISTEDIPDNASLGKDTLSDNTNGGIGNVSTIQVEEETSKSSDNENVCHRTPYPTPDTSPETSDTAKKH